MRHVYLYIGEKKWQSTAVFLPGESHGQRSLVGYSPWDHTQSDMTVTNTHTRVYILRGMLNE